MRMINRLIYSTKNWAHSRVESCSPSIHLTHMKGEEVENAREQWRVILWFLLWHSTDTKCSFSHWSMHPPPPLQRAFLSFYDSVDAFMSSIPVSILFIVINEWGIVSQHWSSSVRLISSQKEEDKEEAKCNDLFLLNFYLIFFSVGNFCNKRFFEWWAFIQNFSFQVTLIFPFSMENCAEYLFSLSQPKW